MSVSVVDEFAEPPGEVAGDDVEAADAAYLEGDDELLDWEPPALVDRYEIGEHLTTSRLGRTYSARDAGNDTDVEVTFLYAEALAAAGEPEARLEELRDLQHLHVLPLLDWQLDPVPYLVFPAPAMRLESLIHAGAALSPSQALLIGLQAAETLDNLHGRGIANGALTPSHFCIDARGRLRLAEMGVGFLRVPPHADEVSRYDDPGVGRPVDDAGAPSATAEIAALVEEFGTAGTPGGPVPAVTAEAPVEEPEDSGEPAAEEPADAGEAAAEEPGDSGEAAGSDPWLADQPAGAPAGEAGHPPATGPLSSDGHGAAAAADVYGLGLTLAEATAGRPLDPSEIGRLGRSVAPAGAGTAAARNLTRLAPLLVQATAARAGQRLSADEFALALRATAEMFPPPDRLDELFQQVTEAETRPRPSAVSETVADMASPPRPNVLMRVVAAAAVVAAGALLVVFAARSDRTPSHTVPDVAGLDWAEAGEMLAASGWEARRLEVRVPETPAGEVVGQLPEPGARLDEGQVVKVQVSLGEPLVVIPADIVGTTLQEAELRLSAIGLEVGNVTERVVPGAAEGTVVDIAELLPEVPRGSQVDLVIAVAG